MRFVLPDYEDEPGNKLNLMINNVHAIWTRTSDRRYSSRTASLRSAWRRSNDLFRPRHTQCRDDARLLRLSLDQDPSRRARHPGGPNRFHARLQKSTAKQQLFADVNAGRIRILIGSSETMGTGVNAQRRLAALHHLDVPWLPSVIEQREGALNARAMRMIR